jgi:hypothetical protein
VRNVVNANKKGAVSGGEFAKTELLSLQYTVPLKKLYYIVTDKKN